MHDHEFKEEVYKLLRSHHVRNWKVYIFKKLDPGTLAYTLGNKRKTVFAREVLSRSKAMRHEIILHEIAHAKSPLPKSWNDFVREISTAGHSFAWYRMAKKLGCQKAKQFYYSDYTKSPLYDVEEQKHLLQLYKKEIKK